MKNIYLYISKYKYKKIIYIIIIFLIIFLSLNWIIKIKDRNNAINFIKKYRENPQKQIKIFLKLDEKHKSDILKELFYSKKRFLDTDGKIHTKIVIDTKNRKVKKFIQALVEQGDYNEVKDYIKPEFIKIKNTTDGELHANKSSIMNISYGNLILKQLKEL